MTDSRSRAGEGNKISLEHHIMLENKDIKNDEDLEEHHTSQLEGAPFGQICDNLNSKININSNEL